MIFAILLLIFAIVCFFIKFFNKAPRVDWIALGLASFAGGVLAPMLRAFFIIVMAVSMAVTLPSCQTTKRLYNAATMSVSASASDNLIINAEKLLVTGQDTMDTFLTLEYRNRAAYAQVSPHIHTFAEKLRADKNGNGRRDGLDILDTAQTAILAFKANRTAENEANLSTAYNTLRAVLADTQKYTAQALKLADRTP